MQPAKMRRLPVPRKDRSDCLILSNHVAQESGWQATPRTSSCSRPAARNGSACPARAKARPSGACRRPERPRGAIERHDAAALEHDEPARIVKRRRRRSRPEHFEVEVRRKHADRGLHGWFNKIGEAGKGANRAVFRAGPQRLPNVTSTLSRFGASASREGAGDVSRTAAAEA